MKQFLKRILAACGYAIHRLPSGIVTGTHLARDLRIVVGNKRGRICIDVGANDGDTVDLLRGALNWPQIHAFEPHPDTFARLQINHASTPGVRLHNAGIGNIEGTLSLQAFGNHTLNSFLPLTDVGRTTLEALDEPHAITVPVHRLDDYADQNGLSHIHLLKIDTQGYELHVLQGAAALLQQNRIHAAMIELNFVELYHGQPQATRIIELLGHHGLQLVDLYEKCRHNPVLSWCTALFTRR